MDWMTKVFYVGRKWPWSAVWEKGVCNVEGVEKGMRTVMWLLLSS